MQDFRYLRRRDAGMYLRNRYGVGSASSLAKLAMTGEGPTFQKMGHIAIYTPESLDEWAMNKIKPAPPSTSSK